MSYTEDSADVIVAGGGPAGLSVALLTAKAGFKTVVFEREDEIGVPVHTSGGTAVESMRALGIPESCFHVVNRLRLRGPTEAVEFTFPTPTAAILDVTGTYRYLADLATQAGAVIMTGCSVSAPVMRDGAVVGCDVRFADGSTKKMASRVLVDASGYRAAISKAAGLHPGFERFGVGAEYEMIAPNCDQDTAVIGVGSEYAPSGYAWIFPWGNDRVRVGVGILHTDSQASPREYLDKVMNAPEGLFADLRGATIVEKHFGLIPSDGLATCFAGNGIVAVGDAAGQPSLVAGEGIRLSIEAGRLAGEVIAGALTRGQVDQSALRPYEDLFRKRHGVELRLGHGLNRRMGRWNDESWDRKVRLVKDIPPLLIAELLLSRFSADKLLKWVVLRPAMWPRTIRYAVRALVAVMTG